MLTSKDMAEVPPQLRYWEVPRLDTFWVGERFPSGSCGTPCSSSKSNPRCPST